MIIYIKKFYKIRRIYCLIKEEKVFMKYIEILEKVSNKIKKKFNTELIYSKKYLKVEKKRLSMFICTNSIGWFSL